MVFSPGTVIANFNKKATTTNNQPQLLGTLVTHEGKEISFALWLKPNKHGEQYFIGCINKDHVCFAEKTVMQAMQAMKDIKKYKVTEQPIKALEEDDDSDLPF